MCGGCEARAEQHDLKTRELLSTEHYKSADENLQPYRSHLSPVNGSGSGSFFLRTAFFFTTCVAATSTLAPASSRDSESPVFTSTFMLCLTRWVIFFVIFDGLPSVSAGTWGSGSGFTAALPALGAFFFALPSGSRCSPFTSVVAEVGGNSAYHLHTLQNERQMQPGTP